MKKTKILLAFIAMVLLAIPSMVYSQGTTTGSMSGVVVDVNGDGLPGATILAVHTPSGTRYGTASDLNGRFIIPGMRVGGPYKVTVSYIGFASWEQLDVFVNLGSATTINVTLADAGVELQEIFVVAKAGSVGRNTGASTRIGSDEISNLPSINRDLNDFLRLTPQSGAYGGGISFAGTNNRYNAIYIDGAVNNDVFGLASSGTNGGQTGISPFSPDIIDQFQIVLSPYDVTLGGFAGGGVNAVTKSGTNTFEGTAYTYFQNEAFIGKTNGILSDRLDVERERVDEFSETVYGVSLGGPIIKDKMFIFTNVEIQRDETPVPFNISEYTTAADGRATEAQLNDLRNHLINQYDYDPGTFGNTTDNLDGLKIFAKIDYNINESNRLTLRHQYTNAEQFNRNGGNSRNVNFSNNGVFFPTTTNSSAIELNSRFGTEYSNNLIVGFTAVRDDRNPLEKDFPYVFIEDGSGLINIGSERFSTANRLDQDIVTLTNNFNIYRGSHKITIGTHNEFYNIYNVFIGQNFGVYRFASIDDFINGEPAFEYDRSYSLVDNTTGDVTGASADFNAIQLGFYAQDEWSVNRNLTLTGGVRVDIPIITSEPGTHESFNTSTLPAIQAQYEMAEGVVGGEAPDGQIMISPRIGFSYDLQGDGRNIIRGGAGIFTSRIPFVWPGAMFTNNGLTLGRVDEDDLDGDVNFRADINNQYRNPNPTIPAGQIDIFTKDFKYPQVFRTNLAYDFVLPGEIVATIEGLYTKTLNNVLYTNVNSNPTEDFKWTGSPDNRSIYTRTDIDDSYSAIYLASNTSEGYSYNISASFAKSFDFGLNATAAYSYGDAYALSEGTSSQNSSQWRGQVSVNGRNNPSFGRSDFAVGHRVLGTLSYAYNWTEDGNNKTTISLFMNGQSGNPYSYIIAGSGARNLNNETGSTSRNRSLIYIPANASEINLVDYTVGDNVVTAAQQWENLNILIEDDKYLSNNKGSYAEKNGAWSPFGTYFDIAVRHDFGLNLGGQRHRFQVSLDIANFGNMLNPNWGTVYSVPGDFNNYYLYQFEGYEADGTTPQFTFRNDQTGLDRFNISGLASRWSMLLGLRYMFN